MNHVLGIGMLPEVSVVQTGFAFWTVSEKTYFCKSDYFVVFRESRGFPCFSKPIIFSIIFSIIYWLFFRLFTDYFFDYFSRQTLSFGGLKKWLFCFSWNSPNFQPDDNHFEWRNKCLLCFRYALQFWLEIVKIIVLVPIILFFELLFFAIVPAWQCRSRLQISSSNSSWSSRTSKNKETRLLSQGTDTTK